MVASDIVYDDHKFIKRNSKASFILIVKMISTFPFNLIGLYKPELLGEYDWILYIEAFHHYHARIFYLLAIHRNISQLYCSIRGNGFIQRRFIMLEAAFDFSLILLYVHEYFTLHNVKVFLTAYTLIHLSVCLLSLYSLRITSKIKIDSIA